MGVRDSQFCKEDTRSRTPLPERVSPPLSFDPVACGVSWDQVVGWRVSDVVLRAAWGWAVLEERNRPQSR